MRAVCWEGKEKIQVETVPDPVILNPRDAIIKVTTTAICGSDLHRTALAAGAERLAKRLRAIGLDSRRLRRMARQVSARIGLEDAPAMYRRFRDKDDACIKVVIKPV